MRRVVVVGGPGSGKSTVASTLAERIGAPHVELDELWWGPGRTPAGRLELHERVFERLAVDEWVVDGNYIDEIADVVWPAADAVVWLDSYSERLVHALAQHDVADTKVVRLESDAAVARWLTSPRTGDRSTR